MGSSPKELAAEMLRLLGPQADAPPTAARLSLVRSGKSAPDSASGSKEKQP
jgi:hypothetical protein